MPEGFAEEGLGSRKVLQKKAEGSWERYRDQRTVNQVQPVSESAGEFAEEGLRASGLRPGWGGLAVMVSGAAYSKLICYLCVNSCVQVWQKLLQLIGINNSTM